MARKDPKMEALIRRTQAQAAKKAPRGGDAASLGRAWVEDHQHDVERRRYGGSLVYQLTMDESRNPAVGTYISPDGRTLLFIGPDGVPSTEDTAAWATANGLDRLKRLFARASKKPAVQHGPIGTDVLAAYRSYVETPVE